MGDVSARWIMALLLGVISVAQASGLGQGSVETQTRFLEFDDSTGSLAYEVSIRNVGNLPISDLELDSEPTSLEGRFSVDELTAGSWARRRFSFRLEPKQRIFQPRFFLAFTNDEGERIKSENERSPLAANVDFTYCDVATGWVDMVFTLTNLGEDPLLFLELRSENPPLSEGPLERKSLGPGESLSWTLEYQIEPGDIFFNPTLHLRYHSFSVSGTRLQKKFYTFLQKDLRKVQEALAAR